MSGTHFYPTLPSNASLGIFPDNKTTGYCVKLPHPVEMNGDWEVGLYSISYPNTWYTLAKGFDSHLYYADPRGLFTGAVVNYGYYETMEKIVEVVNAALWLQGGVNAGDIKLTYNAVTGKVLMRIKKGYQFSLGGRMGIILGFGGQHTIVKKTTDLPPISTIYVYCDIVQPQIVRDTSAQLLRSIPVTGKSGDMVTKTFTNIQYVPVQTKSFEDVEILLWNRHGRASAI